jgi:hypothetical protein
LKSINAEMSEVQLKARAVVAHTEEVEAKAKSAKAIAQEAKAKARLADVQARLAIKEEVLRNQEIEFKQRKLRKEMEEFDAALSGNKPL